MTVDELRIGTAETYDVIVTPRRRAYTIFAQAMDRSGYARGTLAPRAGMTAAVPATRSARAAHDERHGHGSWHGGMTAVDHAAMGHDAMLNGAARHARPSPARLVDMRAAMPRRQPRRSRASACATTAGAC